MTARAPARDVRFFPDAAAFRTWLAREHRRDTGLWVKFHRVDSGRKSVSFVDALNEALCFGWIDGLRKRVGTASYLVHFARRQAGSHWSRPNIARAKALIASGRMTPAGRKAFEARDESATRVYAVEVRRYKLDRQAIKEFRANPGAWAYYGAQPPGYKRLTTMWVMSAAKLDTRARRLARLIDTCAGGKRIPPFND